MDANAGYDHHHDHESSLTRQAVAATLHCLTGCAIGEIVGMVIASAFSLSNAASVVLSIALAFLFGYSLTLRPLLGAGLPLKRAFALALASDTVSISTMELVDNAFILLVPGAIAATLSDGLFWWSLLVSLVLAFLAAVPVNRWLLSRGRGHAVVHEFHQH